MRLQGIWIVGEAQKQGEYVFEVQARDEIGQEDSRRFALEVLAPPAKPLELLTTELPPCVVCVPYSQNLLAQGGYPPYQWQVTAGRLPEGLGFSGGRVTGTVVIAMAEPTAAEFTVKVIDVVGASVQGNVRLSLQPNDMIALRAYGLQHDAAALGDRGVLELPPAVVGEPYSVELPASGGFGKLTWRVVSGALHVGLRLEDHRILGTCTAPGMTEFTIQVSDSLKQTAQRRCRLKALPPVAKPLQIMTTELPAARIGEPYLALLRLTGGVAPYRWKITEGALPSWASLKDDMISGTPSNAGQIAEHVISVIAADSSDAQAGPVRLVLQVQRNLRFPNPKIAVSFLPLATKGESYEVLVPVTGGLPPFSLRLLSGTTAPGIALSPDGILRGKPQEAGAWRFAVSAVDSLGQSSPPAEFEMIVRQTGPVAMRLEDFFAPVAVISRPYKLRMPVFGGVMPYQYKLEGVLPPGVRFEDETGQLIGSPTETGNWHLTLRVSDSCPVPTEAVRTFELMVVSDPVPDISNWRLVATLSLAFAAVLLSILCVVYLGFVRSKRRSMSSDILEKSP